MNGWHCDSATINQRGIKKNTTANGGDMVTFWIYEKRPNGSQSWLCKAFDDVARRIVNMKLEPGMRVNIIDSELEKYGNDISVRVYRIDYADPKPKKREPPIQKPVREQTTQNQHEVDLSKGNPFQSWELPTEF